MIGRLLVAAILLGSAGHAAAAVPNEKLAGVWEGTIGTLPVRACFVHKDYGVHGAYYYRSRLATIPLIDDAKKPGEFTEGWADQKGPRWTITAAGAGELRGSWHGAGKTLSILLKPVPAKLGEYETPCDSAAFFEPRLGGLKLVSSALHKDGVAMTRWSVDFRGRFPETALSTFTLDGDTPAIRNINQALRQPLGKGPEDWTACARSSLVNGAFEGADSTIVEPRMVSRRWLVANHHWDGFCGGAHPDSSNSSRLFDRESGAEINIWTWFAASAVERHDSEPGTGSDDPFYTVRQPLLDVVLKGWKGDEECGEAVAGEQFWNAELTRTGMTFTPKLAHVIQACEEDFAVPFARLRPLLSDAGRRAVDALTAERRR